MSTELSRLSRLRARALVAAALVALPLAPAVANRPLNEHGAHDVPDWVKHRVELQPSDPAREVHGSFGLPAERDS
jgi:hypothetical protein